LRYASSFLHTLRFYPFFSALHGFYASDSLIRSDISFIISLCHAFLY
jgi:hypothetical protein